jgi:hypothetical protein
VDEFENGLRIVAEESGVQVYAVEDSLLSRGFLRN